MNNKIVHLDKKDKQIVTLLQKDARMSIAEISRELGVQRDTVFNRIERMERKGLILAYQAIIKPDKVGYDIFAIFMIQVTPTPSQQLEEFTSGLISLAHVTHVNKTVGLYDYIVYTAHNSMEQLNTTLDQIKSIQNGFVQKIDVINILDEIKTDDFSGVIQSL